MHAAEPLSHFVDDYLAYLYEVCPTNATLDGVHLHDDLLEDFRRGAIETHLSALAGFARRLDAIPVDGLPVHEQVDHGIVAANIRGRVFELEQTRTWERSPHMYGEILASSLATQAIFTYAPEEERARRVLSKLRQVPRLIQAARENVKDAPAIYIKVGLDTWRGVKTFIDADLPRAFSGRRRPSPPGRPRRRVRRSRPGRRRLHRLPGDRPPSPGQGDLQARRREVRAEAAPRRGHHAARGSPSRHRDARDSQHAGRVPGDRRDGSTAATRWRPGARPGCSIPHRAG